MVFGLFKSDIDVSLSLDGDVAVPGSELTAHATIAGEPDERTRGARVELRYVNEYYREERDYSSNRNYSHDRTVERNETYVAAQQQLGTTGDPKTIFGEHTVRLVVPADSPPSSTLGVDMVRWEVAAITDRRRAKDAGAERSVVVRATRDSVSQLALTPAEVDRGCPMELQIAERVLAAGSEVAGTLVITPLEAEDAQEIRVQLFAERNDPEARQTKSLMEKENRVVLASAGTLAAGQRYELPFRISVPPDAVSVRAPHNSLTWFLEGIIARARSRDRNVKLPLAVYNQP